jgi:16S rRNA G966 N2-methylase RsmD
MTNQKASRPVIQERSPDALKPFDRNARTHSQKQIRKIAGSIDKFGFINPVLIDAKSRIIAGHGRVAAAKLLGIEEIPTLAIEHLGEADLRAYVLADNRLAEEAGWDKDILRIEFQHLATLELDFDLSITGFEEAEIEVFLNDGSEGPEDSPPPNIDRDKPSISAFGDLWTIGPHRLLCADALKRESYSRLLNGEQAQLVFIDPPYNVPVPGHVSGLGKVSHKNFAMASGEMSEAQFTEFLETVFERLAAVSINGAIHFICMDWRHFPELSKAGGRVYGELKNLCVWVKPNGGMGSLYRSRHELIAVYKNGTASHINNVELGKHGRYRTNVWEYAGLNSFQANRDEMLALHPTVKPVALVKDAILDCSHRGGIVLDAFAGSGTTLIAAERVGRRGYGIEIDPYYVDAALARIHEASGIEPADAMGRTFNERHEMSLPDEKTARRKKETKKRKAEKGVSHD